MIVSELNLLSTGFGSEMRFLFRKCRSGAGHLNKNNYHLITSTTGVQIKMEIKLELLNLEQIISISIEKPKQ